MNPEMPKKRNSFAGILKRQKFIVTKIRNPDGTTKKRVKKRVSQ